MVITVIPADFHDWICSSISIMFVDSRYIAGFRLCVFANSWIFKIGDGRVFPFANQFSSSITQKSKSLCVIIACVSVVTISSMTSKKCPDLEM